MYDRLMAQKNSATFVGSIPENYDRYLAPIQLEAFAGDLARRVPATGLGDVLELACGTGLVTRHLRERLEEPTRLVATDFSEPMLKYAQTKPGIGKKVEWKMADATALPFPDGSFDIVVCGFGFMFFPDKDKASAEIFRVLRPGGRLLFTTWDKIEFNDFPHISHTVVGEMFEGDPPPFFGTPFGFYDHFEIRTLLRKAGFIDVALTTVEMKVQGAPADAAMGLVRGNPIANEIEARGKDVSQALEKVEQTIAKELGAKVAKGKARAIIVGGRKPGVLVGRSKAPAATTASPAAKAAAKPKSSTRVASPKKPSPKPGKGPVAANPQVTAPKSRPVKAKAAPTDPAPAESQKPSES